MIGRLMICEELCKLAGVKRVNRTRTSLSKAEMVAIWKHMARQNTTIEQLTAARRAAAVHGSHV